MIANEINYAELNMPPGYELKRQGKLYWWRREDGRFSARLAAPEIVMQIAWRAFDLRKRNDQDQN